MNVPILARPTLPVVTALPSTANEGDLVVYDNALYIYASGQWRRTPPELPVGSVLISVDATNPATWLGYGTWQQFAQGRCLVGVDTTQTEFNAPLKTGGAKTHTLTVNEMPSHSHTYTRYNGLYNAQSGSGVAQVWSATQTAMSTGNTGGGQPHNNLQPYICVYFWRRTA
ncbi:MAG: hypothetical protein KatS3mg038_2914 [Candidatus Kapaibacterium sp.]|nr:MAG: hypothetical protein KatS3mg038_2914 [Candidatus Kapabacteria bacterium]